MKLYGVAVALTGKDANAAHITCTTTVVDTKNPAKTKVVQEHSFETLIDLTDKKQRQDIFCKIADSISAATILQMNSFDDSEKDYRPVALVLGIDGREVDGKTGYKRYNIKSLSNFFLQPEPTDISTNQQLKKAYEKMGVALRHCTLSLHNFGITREAKASAAQEPENEAQQRINKGLLFLKELLDNGSPEEKEFALKELGRIAYILGSAKAESDDHIEDLISPRWKQVYYHEANSNKSDTHEEKPRNKFLSWHPSLRHIFTEAYKAGNHIQGNIIAKFPFDEKEPFFTSITHAIMLNQIDIMNGDLQEHHVTHMDRTEIRKQMIDRFTEIGCQGSMIDDLAELPPLPNADPSDRIDFGIRRVKKRPAPHANP